MEHNPTQDVKIEVIPGARDDIRVVKVHGPLTIHNFFDFQDIVRKQPPPRILLVDMTNVPYIDSAVLGTLVGIHVSCERGGRKYALIGVTERVKALFVMSGLDQLFVTRDDIANPESYLLE